MKKRRPTHSLQMFSFLDAMVCTVGALLVLLHAFARHGTDEAVRRVDRMQAEADLQTDARLAELKVESEKLQQARSQLQEGISQRHASLAHLEDHRRRLLEQIDALRRAAYELDQSGRTDTEQRDALLAEIKSVDTRIAQAREAVEKARREAKPETTYSVVPYDGPNSTRRRPIYIECREDRIVIQPEGVEITPDDFAGITGPGNPLAAAVRGISEHWSRDANGGAAEQPYPLLLVRPGGMAAFWWARSALASWGSDFGYELVGEDWELKYPEANPQVAEKATKIVAESRMRMREMAVAMRQIARERPKQGYVATRGGLVPDRTPRGSGSGTGLGPGFGDDPWSSPTSGGFGGGKGKSGLAGDDEPFGGREGLAAGSGNSRSPGGSGGNRYVEAGRTGQPSSESSTSLGKGDSGEGPNYLFSAPAGAGASAPGGDVAVGAASLPLEAKKKRSSLAKSRGSNWGLPDSRPGATGITRPIVVDCRPDRLVIVPDSRNIPPKEVPLAAETHEEIDQFVGAVWDHMKSWGSAGKGFYWRPTILMDIQPGAADRYAEIKALLADSGLEIQERKRR